MNNSWHSDPAERRALMRLFYRNWRPTRLGRWANRLTCWWSGLGLPPEFQAALEVRGLTSGRNRSSPVVIATVEGKQYLVSMLGPESHWVKNIEAARGDAVIRHGRRRRVHLVELPPEQRAPVLREYVRIATSGRRHFPLSAGGPTHLVAALDLWMIVSPAMLRAFWLVKGRPWGYVVATATLVEGVLTTLVLVVSAPVQSAAAIQGAWDLVPLWLVIGIGCLVCSGLILRDIRPEASKEAM